MAKATSWSSVRRVRWRTTLNILRSRSSRNSSQGWVSSFAWKYLVVYLLRMPLITSVNERSLFPSEFSVLILRASSPKSSSGLHFNAPQSLFRLFVRNLIDGTDHEGLYQIRERILRKMEGKTSEWRKRRSDEIDRRYEPALRRLRELEDCIAFAIVSALKNPGFVKPLAKAIYDQQAQESPKVRNIRDKLSEIGMKKTNLMNAIMMGVVTDTTKSTLTELQIQHRKFSRAEIEASLEILADKPFKTDMEKKALFTKFITRIDLYKDGRMNIYTDIFGIKGEIQAIDKSKSEVQLEKRLSRH